MATERRQFTAFSRLLHWLMAPMVLSMLGIGVAMVVSVANYHRLVSLHRPLGMAILILVVMRYVNRKLHPPPVNPNPRQNHSRQPSGRIRANCIWNIRRWW